MGPGAEAPGSVSTVTLPQDAYAARRASMTTLSLAFRIWSGARNGGCPRRTGRVPTDSRIVSHRDGTELAIPLPPSRTYFAPIRNAARQILRAAFVVEAPEYCPPGPETLLRTGHQPHHMHSRFPRPGPGNPRAAKGLERGSTSSGVARAGTLSVNSGAVEQNPDPEGRAGGVQSIAMARPHPGSVGGSGFRVRLRRTGMTGWSSVIGADHGFGCVPSTCVRSPGRAVPKLSLAREIAAAIGEARRLTARPRGRHRSRTNCAPCRRARPRPRR